MECLYRLAVMLVVCATATACANRGANPVAPTPPGTTVSAVALTSASTSGATFQLSATARLSDGTSRDATSTAMWWSSCPAFAGVSSTGMVTVVASGELDVRATYQGITGSMHLLVAATPVVAVTVSGAPGSSSSSASASSFQLTANARLADGGTRDVTRSAMWQSSNAQLATVTTSGYVIAVGNGDVDLAATYQGVVGSVHVSVSLPPTFTLSGVIAEGAPGGRPIGGARVQIVVGNYTFSDDRGAFTLTGVPAGRSIIEVSKTGYQTWTNEVVVDRDTQLTVTLAPPPPIITVR